MGAAIACALAGILASPLLVASLGGAPTPHFSANGSWTSAQFHDYVEHYSTDLLSYVVPRGFAALRFTEAPGLTSRFVSNSDEDGAYLGVPLLALVALFAIVRRRRRSTWLLITLFAVAVVLSLGPHCTSPGTASSPCRGGWRRGSPGSERRSPSGSACTPGWSWPSWWRCGWARSPAGVGGMDVVLLSLVAIFPVVPRPSDARVPSFFAGGAYARYLHPGETVLAIPAFTPSDFLAWQAATGYGFNLAGGYVGYRAIPRQSERQPGFYGIVTNRPGLVSPADLAGFVRLNHVGAVIVPDAWEPHWGALVASLGARPVHVDGFWVSTLSGTA